MKNNFDLKKFLIENKLTANSRQKVDEKNYANFTAKKIKSDFKKATDSDIGGIDTSLDPYEDRKEIISQVVQLIKSSMPADNGTIKDFIRTHYDDIINLGDDEAILDEFQEFLSKGTVSSEKKGNLKEEDEDYHDDGDYPVLEAFKKAGIDMSKEVHIHETDGGTPGLGGGQLQDEGARSAESAARYFEDLRTHEIKDADDTDEFPIQYEYSYYGDAEPEGKEFKMTFSIFEGTMWDIFQ